MPVNVHNEPSTGGVILPFEINARENTLRIEPAILVLFVEIVPFGFLIFHDGYYFKPGDWECQVKKEFISSLTNKKAICIIFSIMKLNIEKINSERKKKGWTKYQLACQMDVNRQWIYAVLSKPGNVTLATINKIADALGIDARELVE